LLVAAWRSGHPATITDCTDGISIKRGEARRSAAAAFDAAAASQP